MMLVLVLLFYALEWPASGLIYQRSLLIYEDQWWRLLTAPLIHFSWQHLLLNLSLAWPLMLLLERRKRSHLLFLYCTSTLLTTVYIFHCLPKLEYFAGLSGFIMALWIYTLCDVIATSDNFKLRLIVVLLFLLSVLKIILEAAHISIFSGNETSFHVVWQAHAFGLVSGLCLAAWLTLKDFLFKTGHPVDCKNKV
ncbi:MAG: rhombosortase [Mariprofundaceae bacterium]|nr:rhombosortase [Mariprofundaceae bacterium]